MSESKHISIPKKVETENQLDFNFLRKTGVKYIEELGGKLWTDFNSHDPGITTLEVLSYAITDLGMRMNLDIEDILASNESTKSIETQFVKASDILPSRPVNELDYRKLFIDISSSTDPVRPISNCWLLPHKETLYTDCRTGNLSATPNPSVKQGSFEVKGLYDVYVDYAQDALNNNVSECDKSNARIQILERYHANRGLCEDIMDILEIQTQPIAVCTRINLVNKANEEFVHAKILKCISNYLSPEIHFYSLKQMLEKGYTTDQIFDGPLLDHGFIDTKELENSQLRKEIRLSDIISEIMKVEGVKEILEISIAGCDNTTRTSDDWVICIEEGSKPVLCDMSSFSYTKGALSLNINQQQVNEFLDTFKKEEDILRVDASGNELKFPVGTPYELGSYASILNEFPDTYGVGTAGIIDNPTPEREALAKQFKGYLLFFDQILASYFKHLEKVKEILSINGSLKRTYFTQAIKGIKDFEGLVNGYDSDDDKLTDALYQELDNSVERRNAVLDHLISRFAETFSDYTFLMKSLYGKSTDEIVLKNKEVFLKEYKTLSADRGLGYNYTLTEPENLWNTSNVSGVQKRIARLLGIKNYKHRDVSASPVIITNTGTTENPVFNWKIKEGNNVMLSSANTFMLEFEAIKALHKAVYLAIQIDSEDLENSLKDTLSDGDVLGNIRIRASEAGNFYLEILDDSDVPNVVARHKQTCPYPPDDPEVLKTGIRQLVEYLKYDYTEDGICVIEHILLKPAVRDYHFVNAGIGCMSIDGSFIVTSDHEETVSPEQVEEPHFALDADQGMLMDTCADSCQEENAFDPYSYRVSIVLPGYTQRFSEPDFRRFAETLIREELPAHVLAKICWVGDRQNGFENAQSDLANFERKFKKYLSDKASNAANLGNSTSELLNALSDLNNIYRPGRLLDCDLDTDEDSLEGKIILGQSNI